MLCPCVFMMKPRFTLSRRLILFICVYLWSCSPAPETTPFIPPTAQAPLIEPSLIINPTPQIVQIQPSPFPTILPPTVDQTDCFNNLTFVEDATVPDNSFVTFGSSIDKQWLVENSGTCNWNSGYRLKHIGGAALGASEEIALYPARSGAQTAIQIIFTAPFTDGVYESAWQAYDPDGNPFGDPIYMSVVVTAP